MSSSKDIVQRILDLPFFHAGWVLYFLLFLSLASFAVIFERLAFYRSRRVDDESRGGIKFEFVHTLVIIE